MTMFSIHVAQYCGNFSVNVVATLFNKGYPFLRKLEQSCWANLPTPYSLYQRGGMVILNVTFQ